MVKYAPGNTYGPYNFLLLRRSDRVNCAGKHLWGIYQCNCNKHTEFEALNRNVENGHCHGCPECLKLFKQEVARNNRKYLPGQYDCLLCGKTMSCGCIGSSRGEDVLKQLLTSLNIKFFQEQQFNDCINDKTRRQLFDFYLPEYNICIEYDGQQHYKDIKGWADTLEDIQYRDTIKNQYCKKHNMSLIRIPYWDYDRLNVQYLMSLIESHQGSEVDGFTEPNRQSC